MASVKAKQDDLRRLMKERRENLQNKKDKVDSPFAKYNNLGQLFCTICNIQIKSNSLWAAHVGGKMHKENALKKKKGVTDIPSNSVLNTAEKRTSIQPLPIKKLKTADESTSTIVEPMKSTTKVSLLDVYSSSSDEEDEPESIDSPSKITSKNELPKDFFDAVPSSLNSTSEEKLENVSNTVPANSVDALPEGFFDDPVLDAKVRNIEYKDPVEEEWEKYQKAIAEETNVSKSIIEEDLEESTLERDLTEIDVLMNLWEKSKNLQTLAEEASSKIPSNNEKGDSTGSTDDDLEEEDLLDWRSKGVKQKR